MYMQFYDEQLKKYVLVENQSGGIFIGNPKAMGQMLVRFRWKIFVFVFVVMHNIDIVFVPM